MDGQPAPAGDVGSVAFDVADRLAIINLFGAYAYTYDENRLDEFRALFTESPQLVLLHEGRPLSADIDRRHEPARGQEGGVQGRKQPTAPRAEFVLVLQPKRQRSDRTLFVQVFAIKDGGPPTPDLTGRYEFTAVKHDGAWRFGRWVVALDQTPPSDGE